MIQPDAATTAVVIPLLWGIIMTVVAGLASAGLTLLLRASGERAKFKAQQVLVETLQEDVKNIQTELAKGGPEALSRRVDELREDVQRLDKRLEDNVKTIGNKVDAIHLLIIQLVKAS